MNKTLLNLLLACPALLGMSSVVSVAAIAQEVPSASEVNQLAQTQASESPTAVSLATNDQLELHSSPSATTANPENLASPKDLAPAGQDSQVPTAVLPQAESIALETVATPGVERSTASTPKSAAPSLASQANPTLQLSELSVSSSLNPTLQGSNPPVAPRTSGVSEQVAQTPVAPMTGPILPAAPAVQPSSGGAMSQVTSVSQLSDVQPTDWAFQALQSLVERYGCIAGYPDGTFRGNRALTRYEFAAGVNACLDQINRLIADATGRYVTKEDLAILQRLQEEFAAELASLRGRVDALEARTAELEANQFSTTTKLNGETIFAISDTFGESFNDDDDTTVTNMGYRVRLNLNTSFTGQDLLRTRLQATNIARYDKTENTNMARLGFDGDDGSQIVLDQLWYRFPAGRATFFVGARGLALDDIADVVTPFNSSGTGALSRFGQRNPAAFRGPDGAGAAFTYRFSNSFRAQVGYLASGSDAPNPSDGRGFFSGSHSALAQLVFSLGNTFDVGLTYTRKYARSGDVNLFSGTGSTLANRPFGQAATTADNFSAQVNWKISRGFQLGGWFGYTRAEQQRGGDDSATIMNGAVNVSFPDFGKRGNLLGFVVGVPPRVESSDDKEDKDTSLHIEGFYRWQVTDFISVTPGVFVITNPEHNKDNDTVWVGVLRTTFTF